MKKYLLLISVMVLSVASALAVPAYPYPVKVTQPDGTQLTIQGHGDEFLGYVTTEDGYNIAYNSADGFYYYATVDGNRMVPTTVRARNAAQRAAADRAALSKVGSGFPSGVATSMAQANRMLIVGNNAPSKVNIVPGQKFRSLIILVNFTDKQFTTPNANTAFTNLLNQDGYSTNGGTGSAWNYYYDNSYGNFDGQFDVVGPVNINRSYIVANGYRVPPDMDNIVKMAVQAADAAGVNFAQYADNGVVRDIFIFYAGNNQAEGAPNTIWPHRGGVSNINVDGVSVRGYACTSEFNGLGSTMAGIGTFCHEFGHVIGLPDFYDTDYSENGQSVRLFDDYSLMCSGGYNNNGRTPPSLNSIERYLLDWLEPKSLNVAGHYSIPHISESEAYIINTLNSGEYFLLEHRSNTNKWDKYISGLTNGIQVLHIDRSEKPITALGNRTPISLWNANDINVYAGHPCARVVPTTSTGSTPIFTSGLSLSYPSNANFKSWTGNTTYRSISNITSTGTGAEFDLVISVTQANVTGKIINNNNAPVNGATVVFRKVTSQAGSNGAMQKVIQIGNDYSETTNVSGTFTISGLPIASYEMSITKSGYVPYVKTIDIGPEGFDTIFKLTPLGSGTVTDLAFAESDIAVNVGDYRFIKYSFTPSTASAAITWSYGTTGIVEITNDGNMRALAAGTTTVIASISGKPSLASFNVTVSDEISGNVSAVLASDEMTATVSWTPAISRPSGWLVRWKNQYDTDWNEMTVTSNTAILPRITKNSNYNVEVGGLRLDGEVWGMKTAAFSTSSAPEATSIALDQTTLSIYEEANTQLIATVTPADAYNSIVLWSSSDDKIVSVDDEGNITGVRTGTATITAKTIYGNLTATCQVIVIAMVADINVVSLLQNDVYVSWAGSIYTGQFKVDLYKGTATTTVQSFTTDETEAFILPLVAASDYRIVVTTIGLDGGEASKQLTFTTPANVSNYFVMSGGIKGEYSSSEQISLRVINLPDNTTKVVWRVAAVATTDLGVDAVGDVIEPPYTTLTSGRYALIVEITTSAGKVEKVTKIITVN